jgi:Secretion system C-terminal sorting domain
MRVVLIIISLCIINLLCKAQVNLVPNPSFEDTIGCPWANNQIYFANHWNSLDSTTNFQDNCKADYYNNCSINQSPTSNLFFNKSPKTGNGLILSLNYSYDTLYDTDFRNYSRVRLYSNLVAGKNYCGKFYTTLVSISYFATNKIGAYLDNGTLDTNTVCSALDFINAQVISNSVISDTTNWVKVENTFPANGTERYITLGCFKNHFNLQATPFNTQSPYVGSFYLIDDVSVVDYNLPAFAGTDAMIANGDSVYLGRPNEIGPECRWWANGVALNDSSLGFWAKPTQPTQYVLQQKICGNIKYDTVFVNVSGHVGLAPTTKAEGAFKLVPNPNNGSFIISSMQATYNNVIIYSIDGKEVYNNKLVFTKGNANLDLDLPNGVYHVKLIGSGGVASQKLVISK